MAEEIRYTHTHAPETIVEETGTGSVAIVAIIVALIAILALVALYWNNIFPVTTENTIIQAPAPNTVVKETNTIRETNTIVTPQKTETTPTDSGQTGGDSGGGNY